MVCTERADQQSKKRVNSRDKLVTNKNLPVEIGKVIFFLVVVCLFWLLCFMPLLSAFFVVSC